MKICFTVASLNTYNRLKNIGETLYYRAFPSENLLDCCLIDGAKYE